MRAEAGKSLLWVSLIVLALMLLVLVIPIVLKAAGNKELAELEFKIQTLDKYEEGVTLYLPDYIESVEFIKGYNNMCGEPAGLCDVCSGLEGNTFIVIRFDKGKKPGIGNVLFKFFTFRPNGAKRDAVKMATLNDRCYPRSYESEFQVNPDLIDYIGWALVLEGDNEYCVRIKDSVSGVDIYAKEGECIGGE